MSINFPTSLDTLTNPSPTDYLNSPSHSGQHADANDAIEALEAKVGINSSAVTTSHDYKLSGITGTDKAAGVSQLPTVPVKATGAEINTGTDDAKFATAAAIAASALMKSTAARFKIGSFTKDQTVTGDVAYTGIGFKPSKVLFILKPAVADMTKYLSIGFGGVSNDNAYMVIKSNATNVASGSYVMFTGDGASWDFEGLIKSLDADGFTITYSKTGTPPAGSISVIYLAFM